MVDIKFIALFREASSFVHGRTGSLNRPPATKNKTSRGKIDSRACNFLLVHPIRLMQVGSIQGEWIPFLLEPRVSTPNSKRLPPAPLPFFRFEPISRRDRTFVSNFIFLLSFHDKLTALIERLANELL